MKSTNLFAKIKEAFHKHPHEDKKSSTAPSTDEINANNFTLSEALTDELKFLKRKVILRKSEPYTKDEIIFDCLDDTRVYILSKRVEGSPQTKLRGLGGHHPFRYFKKCSPAPSTSLLKQFSENETLDLGSKEVLEFINTQQESPQSTDSPLFCVAMLGTHNDKPILEHIYYDKEEESTNIKSHIEKELLAYGMPDTVYNASDNFIYFFLNLKGNNLANPEKEKEEEGSENEQPKLFYGVSFFQKFQVTAEMKEKYPEINRPTIQKAICIVSQRPIFGLISSQLQPLLREYFRKSAFSELENKEELYKDAQVLLKKTSLDFSGLSPDASAKKVVYILKEKIITIWKALFLEARVLVFSENASAPSTFISSLLSLFPCATYYNYQSKSFISDETHFNEYGLPLKLFHNRCLLLPYFGTQQLDEVVNVKGYLGGTSNFLIKTLAKVSWDVLIDIDTHTVQFKNEELHKILLPSKPEKDMINLILEKMDIKGVREDTEWSRLNDSAFADADDKVEYEGTEEWVREKFSEHLASLLTEFEFFRHCISDPQFNEILEDYNDYMTKKDKEFDVKNMKKSISALFAGKSSSSHPPKTEESSTPDTQKSEEHKEETKEEEKTEEGASKDKDQEKAIDRKESLEIKEGFIEDIDPRITMKFFLSKITKSVQTLKNYGIDWLLEWSKTDNYKIWTQERNEAIQERSASNPQVKQHLWIYKNGDIYLGNLAHGKREGNGQHLYKHSRLLYKGDWLNDKRCGTGVLSSLEGTEVLYDGEFKEDKKHGFGRLLQGKEKYTGNFANDLYQGSGVLIDAEQNIYEGEFKNGLKWGMGRLKFHNGESYLGDFVQDTFEGQGQFIYQNGDVYSGSFEGGQRTGEGILQVSSGDIYEGKFRNGELEGYAKFTRSDKHIFEGEFWKGKFIDEQVGKITYPDGSRYEGVIENFKAQGKGVLLKKEGDEVKKINGRFEDDKLVEEFPGEEPAQDSGNNYNKEDVVPGNEGEEVQLFDKSEGSSPEIIRKEEDGSQQE